MVLGYFGKTPVEPDPEIIKLASEQLELEPTTENPLDISDRDENKSMAHWKKVLEENELETTEENIFIAASCDQKGIDFLKGDSPLMVRKGKQNNSNGGDMSGSYTVVVDGEKFSVQVAEGDAKIEVKDVSSQSEAGDSAPSAPAGEGNVEVRSQTPGNVWKILKSPGDKVEEGEKIMILEAMKMEIDVTAPHSGTIAHITVSTNEAVEEGQVLATMD
jgi:pyruvate carboxylase subunit B